MAQNAPKTRDDLLPVVLGVAIAYLISSVFRLKPLYDVLLEIQLEDTAHLVTRQTAIVTVERHSVADEVAIRDILWPCGVLVESIRRNGASIIAHSDTVLKAGDELTVHGEYETQTQLTLDVEEIVLAHHRHHHAEPDGENK